MNNLTSKVDKIFEKRCRELIFCLENLFSYEMYAIFVTVWVFALWKFLLCAEHLRPSC